ncbi:MAG: hypothetical protein EAZ55_11290 [Cytophagales bacterium]|nr:MAG: hypothetical protein EAZ55_11290 [Cytophagales bacterium]
MSWLPLQRMVIVSEKTPEEIVQKLRNVTLETNTIALPEIIKQRNQKQNWASRFIGTVQPLSFRICPYVPYTEYFLPLIKGKIERSSRGCIVFLQYSFFPSTLLMLSLGGVAGIVSAFLQLIFKKNFLFFLFLLIIYIGLYSIILFNFKQKIKAIMQSMDQLLA